MQMFGRPAMPCAPRPDRKACAVMRGTGRAGADQSSGRACTKGQARPALALPCGPATAGEERPMPTNPPPINSSTASIPPHRASSGLWQNVASCQSPNSDRRKVTPVFRAGASSFASHIRSAAAQRSESCARRSLHWPIRTRQTSSAAARPAPPSPDIAPRICRPTIVEQIFSFYSTVLA